MVFVPVKIAKKYFQLYCSLHKQFFTNKERLHKMTYLSSPDSTFYLKLKPYWCRCWPFLSDICSCKCMNDLIKNHIVITNTFIHHKKSDKYGQFGFSYNLLNSIHWFQFIDNAAVLTSKKSENQKSFQLLSTSLQLD